MLTWCFDEMSGPMGWDFGEPYSNSLPTNELHIAMAATLHAEGLLDQQVFWRKHTRQRDRFITYAMKRARSNHPHNKRWKPLMGTWTAHHVAEKLSKP